MGQEKHEALHERASQHYLNGRFQEALQVWNQVLDLDPADARALEGARLAGLMVKSDAMLPKQEPMASPGPTEEVTDDVGVNTEPDGLGDDLLSPEGVAEAAEAVTPAPTEPGDADTLIQAPADLTPEGSVAEQLSLAQAHQSAGRFAEAAEAARRALEADPGNPEAQAVLARCEQETPQSEVFEEELSVFDSLSTPAPEPPTASVDSPQAKEIDFGDMSEVEALPLDGAVPTDEPRRGLDGIASAETEEPPAGDEEEPVGLEPAPAAGGQFGLGVPATASETGPSAEPEADPVEVELQRRVKDLLAEAKQAVAENRADDALGILSRIAILDEDNEEAKALEAELKPESSSEPAGDQIEQWIIEGVDWLENGRVAEARERFLQVLEESPDHLEAKGYLETAEKRLRGEDSPIQPPEPAVDPNCPEDAAEQAVEPGVEGIPLAGATPGGAADGALADDLDLEAGTGEFAGVADETPAAAPRKKGKGKLLLVMAALVVVAVIAGVWAVPRFLLNRVSDNVAGEAAAASAGAIDQALADVLGDGQAEATEEATGSSDSAPLIGPEEKAERLASSMTAARSAMENGDYAAAVIAFNEALQIDPGHIDANAGLLEAGDRYREIKEVDQQFERARLAFEDSEYAAALRILYRLPETLDPETVSRMKVNGWYNLAVTALKASDCRRALEHLEEASAIDPEEPGVVELKAFGERYLDTQKDRLYYATIDQLDFRSIDD